MNRLTNKSIASLIATYFSLRAVNVLVSSVFILSAPIQLYFKFFILICFSLMTGFVFWKIEKKKTFILLECIALFMILLSVTINNEYWFSILERCSWIIIAGIPIAYLCYLVTDYKVFFTELCNKLWLVELCCVLIYFFDKGTFSSNMVFGYTLLFPLIIRMARMVDKVTIQYTVIVILEMIMLVSYGSRGPLLVVIGFVIINMIVFHKRISKIFKFTILGLSIGGVCFLVFDGFYMLNEWLLSQNIYIRNIVLLANDGIFSDNGRFVIYEEYFMEILKSPIFGHGISSDFKMGTFPHNLFIQFIYEFGIIVGSIIGGSIIVKTITELIKSSYYKKILIIIFVSVGVIPLLLSSTYIEWLPFWCLLGCLFNKPKTL